MYSQKWKCSASIPIPTFMYLWAIYVFPGSVRLFGCSKIGRLILGIYKTLTDTWVWKLGDKILQLCFGNNREAQFHFWEYVNWNQTLYRILTGSSFAVQPTSLWSLGVRQPYARVDFILPSQGLRIWLLFLPIILLITNLQNYWSLYKSTL